MILKTVWLMKMASNFICCPCDIVRAASFSLPATRVGAGATGGMTILINRVSHGGINKPPDFVPSLGETGVRLFLAPTKGRGRGDWGWAF